MGSGTLVLALATFALAALAFRQLKEARHERRLTEESLGIAEATLRAQQPPELVAFNGSVAPSGKSTFATYGTIRKQEGAVVVDKGLLGSSVGLVSFEARNIGSGRPR